MTIQNLLHTPPATRDLLWNRWRSAPAVVVRCVVGLGGAVWVDKHKVIYYSHAQTPKLFSSRLQTWKDAFTRLRRTHKVEQSRSRTTNTPTIATTHAPSPLGKKRKLINTGLHQAGRPSAGTTAVVLLFKSVFFRVRMEAHPAIYQIITRTGHFCGLEIISEFFKKPRPDSNLLCALPPGARARHLMSLFVPDTFIGFCAASKLVVPDTCVRCVANPYPYPNFFRARCEVYPLRVPGIHESCKTQPATLYPK